MSRGPEKLIAAVAVVVLALTGGTAKFRGAQAPAETAAPRVTATQRPEGTQPPAAPAGTAEETPAAPEGTPAEETPAAEPEYFTLNFVGDCTLASARGFQGGANGYDTVTGGDFAYPFAKTLPYFTDDDFTMANCEVCFTDSTAAVAKTFTFKTGADWAQIFPEGSVEFVTLANNHVLDYGQQGYADTKAALDAVGVGYAGRDEWTVYETRSGLKIGVYAVSFGTVDQINAGIAAVKEAGAEFVIAALHFGDEGSYRVNADQRTQAHAAVDAGADFVYGSHPHTLEPMEEYNGVLITYSMGNWTFGGNTNPRDKDTLILRMTVCRGPDGEVSVSGYEIIPCASSGTTNYNNYQPVPYEKDSEGYQRVLDKLNGDFTGSNLSIGYGYSANE